jgi:hypothetical protein
MGSARRLRLHSVTARTIQSQDYKAERYGFEVRSVLAIRIAGHTNSIMDVSKIEHHQVLVSADPS